MFSSLFKLKNVHTFENLGHSNLVGLSFFERPILGDHAKAHLCGFQWNPADFVKYSRFHADFMKSGRFHKIQWISWNPPENLINQVIQEKLFTSMECSGKAMSQDFTWNLLDFTWNLPDFMKSATKELQLPGMVRPMFIWVCLDLVSMHIYVRYERLSD